MSASPTGYRRTHTILTPQLSVTSGTPARISSTDLWVSSVIFVAHRSNTGIIYLGTSSATALNSSGEGIDLATRESFNIDFEHHRTISGVFNLYDWWFDGTVTSDKLIVIYVK